VLAGTVAKLLMAGKDPGGIWVTMLLGIAGSILATYLGRPVGGYREGQAARFIMSAAGANVPLIAYRMIRGILSKSAKHEVRDVRFRLHAKQVGGLLLGLKQ
jgi:uncharacterized membrane protein YeaQ/YmgE (transglycosylase-associated protein family)